MGLGGLKKRPDPVIPSSVWGPEGCSEAILRKLCHIPLHPPSNPVLSSPLAAPLDPGRSSSLQIIHPIFVLVSETFLLSLELKNIAHSLISTYPTPFHVIPPTLFFLPIVNLDFIIFWVKIKKKIFCSLLQTP